MTQHHLDVSNRAAIAAFPAEVLAAHPGVDILVNNAGVALGGTFEQVSEEDFDWLLSINLFGVVRMTRAFLPVLHKSDEARLVNISSIFGVITPPGQTAYCASKFAVRGFSNSLRYELRGSTIGVSVVHPGGINTNIAKVRVRRGICRRMKWHAPKPTRRKRCACRRTKPAKLSCRELRNARPAFSSAAMQRPWPSWSA